MFYQCLVKSDFLFSVDAKQYIFCYFCRYTYISLLLFINSSASFAVYVLFYIVCFVQCLVFNTCAIVYRATVSAVSCLVVPVFICIYLLIVMCFEIK